MQLNISATRNTLWDLIVESPRYTKDDYFDFVNKLDALTLGYTLGTLVKISNFGGQNNNELNNLLIIQNKLNWDSWFKLHNLAINYLAQDIELSLVETLCIEECLKDGIIATINIKMAAQIYCLTDLQIRNAIHNSKFEKGKDYLERNGGIFLTSSGMQRLKRYSARNIKPILHEYFMRQLKLECDRKEKPLVFKSLPSQKEVSPKDVINLVKCKTAELFHLYLNWVFGERVN